MNITKEAEEMDVTEVIQSIETCSDQCMVSKRKVNGLPEIEDCPVLKDLSVAETEEVHRMRLVAISTAAFGYVNDFESIHQDYVTTSLKDVITLYKKYDELYKFKNTVWYKLYKWFN